MRKGRTRQAGWLTAAALLCVLATACSPIRDPSAKPASLEVVKWYRQQKNIYRVAHGDTLYSVAFAFGIDFRELAHINHVKAPYPLKPGQYLRLPNHKVTVAAADVEVLPEPVIHVHKASPRHTPNPRPHHRHLAYQHGQHIAHATKQGRWLWPLRHGHIARPFGLHHKPRSSGIDIRAKQGAAVRAAAAGVVVYSGTGICGYGNLLILKNSDSVLSAYAYNRRLLVKVGDHVKRGQHIADVGKSPDGRSVLHFEVRRAGRPVNPLRYLSVYNRLV